MKKILWLPLAATLLSSAALAQTATTPPAAPAPAPAAPTTQPAPMTPPATMATPNASGPATTGSVDANAPLPGANSFTEAQAKAKIEEKGFTQVGALAKDKDGIWRGSAQRDGKTVEIALDYRGNVVAR